MKKSKVRNFFGIGRKMAFSLALFVLVFAAASVVKVQALGNMTGYLWGGSEDQGIGGVVGSGVPDGNETGIGWISMTGTNYGVTIPTSTTGAVTGYAWASASDIPNDPTTFKPDDDKNGLGWIQFDPSGPYPTSGCNGTCPDYSTRRNNNMLEGWARFVSVKDALVSNNSGGWEGWIKMSGANYGVDITKMKGNARTLADATYAWSNELGWIDFSRAEIATVPTIVLTPETFYLEGSYQTLRAEIINETPNNQVISFAESGANADKFNLTATTCNINTDGYCTINVSAADREANYTERVTASSLGFVSDYSDGAIIAESNCSITCPPSVELLPDGSTKNIPSTCSGADCSGLSISGCTGDLPGKIDIGGPSGSYCTASATTSATFSDSTTAEVVSNCGTCQTNVFVERPGWIEVSP